MNAARAYAASTLVHIGLLAALAVITSRTADWEYQVQSGEPITLMASASAMPAVVEEVPVEIEWVDPSPPPPATPPVELVAKETEMTKQSTNTPLPKSPLGEVELASVVQVEQTLAARSAPDAPSPDQTQTEPQPRRPARTATQRDVTITTTAVSVSQPKVQQAGAKVDQPPRKLPANVAPDYPLAARRAGQQGRVLVRADISTEGRVTEVSVHQSSGHSLLDEAAINAVRHWRFFPATSDGAAVATQVLVPVKFSIRLQ